MINMAIGEFVHIEKAIRYDGTNSAEIIAEIGSDPTVTESGGVWEVNDGVRDPITVNTGDWYVINGWFSSAADFESGFRSVSLGRPE